MFGFCLRQVSIASFVMLLSSACVSVDGKASKANDKPHWPTEMRRFLDMHEYQHAWGLFSTSGYEDAGQIMIYALPVPDGPAFVQIVNRGEREIAAQRKLSSKEWKNLWPQLQAADKYANHNSRSFDGVQYQFEHIAKTKGTIKTLHSFDANNPESDAKAGKKYADFFKALQSIKPK